MKPAARQSLAIKPPSGLSLIAPRTIAALLATAASLAPFALLAAEQPPVVAVPAERDEGRVLPEKAAAVPPGEAARAAPSSAEARLASSLEALLASRLEDSIDPRTLFDVALEDPAAVAQRVGELAGLRSQAELANAELRSQLAAARASRPEAPRPASLDRPPLAPPALVPAELGEPPAAPSEPSTPRSKRMSSALRKQWEEHDALRAEYERRQADYQARRDSALELERAHRAEVAAFEEAKAAFEQAQASHLAALEQAGQRRLAQIAELEARLASSELRRRVLVARHGYLERLTKTYETMGPAARSALGSLGGPRTALREHAARLRELGRAVSSLRQRLAALEMRASTGELVGFLVERERFEQQAHQLGERWAAAADGCSALALELEELADSLETEGRALQGELLRQAAAGAPTPRIDERFLARVRSMRQLRRAVGGQQLSRSPSDLDALAGRLAASFERPEAIGTFGEAESALGRLAESQGEVTALVEARSSEVGRWRLAFERQAITALEPFASAEARSEAYALSVALLGELQDEAADVLSQISAQASSRAMTVRKLVRFEAPARSWEWLLRLGLALAGVGALAFGRRRVPAATGWLVRHLTRFSPLRRHVGGVVRCAGLLQAVVPTLVVLGAGYLILWLIGLDQVEVRIVEVGFRWTMLYLLGRQVLLGLTQRAARGRPALIKAEPATVRLLRLTYERLGVVWCLVAASAELVSRWLGGGRLKLLIELVLALGVGAWGLWACLAWRVPLAKRLERSGARWAGLAAAMRARRPLAVASPLALALLVGGSFLAAVRRLAEERGLSTYLRARELERLARKSALEPAATRLPPAYLQHFPLHPGLGLEEAALLEREVVLAPVLEQVSRWRETRAEGSLVLVGEKGVGKSTLCGLLGRRLSDQAPLLTSLATKALDEAGLVGQLAGPLGAPGAGSVAELTAALVSGPRRVVVVDDAHNCFLRVVDGYRGFDALVRLVNATSEQVFWVLVFNRPSWLFLEASQRREHSFCRVLELPRWSAAELQELVSQRNARSGFAVRFHELLLDDESQGGERLELVEGADGFFRLLWESSRGNPRVATCLWLSALRRIDDNALEVGLFGAPDPSVFARIGSEPWFALAAICQHENLTSCELGQTLNVGDGLAAHVSRSLRALGLVEGKRADPERMTLAPRYYNQVLDRLRAKHLLFEE